MKKEKVSPTKKLLQKVKEEGFKAFKVSVTTRIDADVVLALKEMALKDNSKYQTLINEFLREAVLGEKRSKKKIATSSGSSKPDMPANKVAAASRQY
jgi:DNA phosphorothioation-dependent restriction protein DptG